MKKLLIILIIFLSSCVEKPPVKIVHSKKVLIAKTIALDNGRYYCLLAFNDGYTETTSFGYYSCLQIGDTVLFEKAENRTYWNMKAECGE